MRRQTLAFWFVHLLVMAKAPVPGRVKTRMCPPFSPHQAADYAEACLADTLDAVLACGADDLVLALDDTPGAWLPPGFRVVPQRGRTFNDRLACAWVDAGGPGLQIGMDTPQITAELLDAGLAKIQPGRALLGPASDGGWWSLGLASPAPHSFDGVTMSRSDTGQQQRRQLELLGYTVELLDELVDVDDIDDAWRVAQSKPALRSSRMLRASEVLPPCAEISVQLRESR